MGAYAERTVVPADRLVKLPEHVEFDIAASLMLQGMTAHYLSHSTYPLKEGDWCLIHAAAGGVGQLLVQMAKMLGAHVIGTAGSADKVKIAQDLGADEVINYSEKDFEQETKRLTDGKGVHAVYDGVGKTTFDAGLNVLRPRGYMVLFGGASGAVPPLDLIKLSQKGSLFVTRPTLAHHIAEQDELKWRATDVLNWAAGGKLKVSIGQKYALKDVQQAHRDLEGRKTTGKTILVP
jgi:NADPH:quinone reductase